MFICLYLHLSYRNSIIGYTFLVPCFIFLTLFLITVYSQYYSVLVSDVQQNG